MVSNSGDKISLHIRKVISVILNTGIFDYKIVEPEDCCEKDVDSGTEVKVSALLNSISTTLRTLGM